MVRNLERERNKQTKHAKREDVVERERERKVTLEMAAAELGVRGRRRERDVTEENESTMWKTPEPPATKRRKIQEVDVRESRMNYSPLCVQTKNRQGIAVRDLATGASETETSVVFLRRRDLSSIEDQCSSDDDELDCESVSCSSSNEFVEKSKRRLEFVDLEEGNEADETGTSRIYDWRSDRCCEQQPSKAADVESDRRSKLQKSRVTVEETEIEDFFKETEKNLRRKVLESSRKYNFDFEKDEPVGGGRYEWVKLNP